MVLEKRLPHRVYDLHIAFGEINLLAESLALGDDCFFAYLGRPPKIDTPVLGDWVSQ